MLPLWQQSSGTLDGALELESARSVASGCGESVSVAKSWLGSLLQNPSGPVIAVKTGLVLRRSFMMLHAIVVVTESRAF